MTIFVKNKHTLQIEDFQFKCCIGKRIGIKKKRGDKTPKGTFAIEHLYYRTDHKTSTLLKCINIKKSMGWCGYTFPKNITS